MKATGHDGINSKLLKIAFPRISNILTCLFNKCLQTGVFPDIFKVARVQPILKSGEKTNVSNFRPISILCVLSKVFEKNIHKHIVTLC